jgi:DNA-binding transcriptional ArsR family regulator
MDIFNAGMGPEEGVRMAVEHTTAQRGKIRAFGLPGVPLFDYYRIMEEADIVRALGALAQPLRLQVFRALVVVGDVGLTPGAIQEALGVPAATLSFHLKELVASGLVTQERASRNLIYRAAYARMNELLGYLTKNCCQGEFCDVDPTSTGCGC